MVTKETNLETVKIEFRHLRSLLLSSFFHSPSAFTRAVPRPKHPRTVVKFFWQVPFEFSFQRNGRYKFDEFMITNSCQLSVKRHIVITQYARDQPHEFQKQSITVWRAHIGVWSLRRTTHRVSSCSITVLLLARSITAVQNFMNQSGRGSNALQIENA